VSRLLNAKISLEATLVGGIFIETKKIAALRNLPGSFGKSCSRLRSFLRRDRFAR